MNEYFTGLNLNRAKREVLAFYESKLSEASAKVGNYTYGIASVDTLQAASMRRDYQILLYAINEQSKAFKEDVEGLIVAKYIELFFEPLKKSQLTNEFDRLTLLVQPFANAYRTINISSATFLKGSVFAQVLQGEEFIVSGDFGIYQVSVG